MEIMKFNAIISYSNFFLIYTILILHHWFDSTNVGSAVAIVALASSCAIDSDVDIIRGSWPWHQPMTLWGYHVLMHG